MNLRKGFSLQFKSRCQISNFFMKKFKYLDLPQYLFINMISYCCKQKFLYYSDYSSIIMMCGDYHRVVKWVEHYLMKYIVNDDIYICTLMVTYEHKKIFLFRLVNISPVNVVNSHYVNGFLCKILPQHEVKFYRGNRLHSVNSQHWLVKC
jgi:phosphoribosylaminoimidazole-succinocarboxamide synthase